MNVMHKRYWPNSTLAGILVTGEVDYAAKRKNYENHYDKTSDTIDIIDISRSTPTPSAPRSRG